MVRLLRLFRRQTAVVVVDTPAMDTMVLLAAVVSQMPQVVRESLARETMAVLVKICQTHKAVAAVAVQVA